MPLKNKRIYLSPPHMSGDEINYVKDAIQSNWVAPIGPHVDQFEDEMAKYIGVNHAVALSSGTAALHLALKIVGVKEGDLVFCSDLTFVASGNAICYLGAIPVFIDSEDSSWNMCPQSLEWALKNNSPKAVIVTDIYGQSANYEMILNICEKFKIPIIEDAAESLGAVYKGQKCGSFGEMAIFSFNGNKIITTSGGGMLLSNNAEYIERARKLASQARESVVHYEHLELGYNYRMSNIIAAIGRAQLKSLDSFIEKRKRIFSRYKKELNSIKGVSFMPEINHGSSTRWLSIMMVNDPVGKKINSIIHHLEKKNIEARPVWKPMHLQPLYHNNKFFSINDQHSISEQLYKNGLCLPSGSSLTEADQSRVVAIIKSCFNT